MFKKIIFLSILFLFISVMVYSNEYWDFPLYILKNSKTEKYINPEVVAGNNDYLIFYFAKAGNRYSIEYLTTGDFIKFKGPYSTGALINAGPMFIPQYNVVSYKEKLYLIWDNPDGSLKFSTGNLNNQWSKPKKIETGKPLTFRPKIYILNNGFYITYHSESEERRIDFFIIKTDDNFNTFGKAIKISKNLAGSFFPFMYYYKGRYFCFWQSRPFTEKKVPVFNIYMSVSYDGENWSDPQNLTGDMLGEKKIPYARLQNNRIELYFEDDSSGTWGIYRRFYDLSGKPLEVAKKLNLSLANTRDYRFLSLGKKSYLFFMDERDGSYKIYYKTISDAESSKEHQLKTGNLPILGYDLTKHNNDIFVFYQNKTGLAMIGPDRTALPPAIVTPNKSLIGKSGIEIQWEKPRDASGLVGYCYTFSDKKDENPEIVNLSPDIDKIQLIPDKERTFYFKIRSKDVAGNLSSIVTLSFNVDLTPPEPPVVTPDGLDKEGFFKENKVIFKWKTNSNDVVGYNYYFSRKPKIIKEAFIRTKLNRIYIKSLRGGKWFFNIAAIDGAGNISDTVHYPFRLKIMPRVSEVKKKVKKAITHPWIISKKTFTYSPIISILLYLVLVSLLVVIIISFWLLMKEIIVKRVEKMEEMEEMGTFVNIRKKRIGLRVKFSLLIASLILVLTVGISTILSYVTINKEKNHLATQMIDKARITLENITNVAREGILNNDELLLVSVIAKTMENKDIKYTIILDTNNRVIAHSDIKQKGKILNDSFTLKAALSDHIIIEPQFNPEKLAKIYNLASPVFFAKKRVGTVQLGYSTESIFKALEESRKDSIYSTIIVTIITLIIGIISAVIMATLTIRPIKTLAKGVYIIGSGNLDYKIQVKAKDEIGILADEFNRMTERLAQYQREMEKKAKLEEQIEIARSIQQNLIPGKGIDNDFVSIGGFYKAATGVGGDYYDFIMKNEKYSLIISDVAGKGVPASLMMTMIRTVFRSLINSGVIYPPRVVSLINSTLISDISSDRFATLLFGSYDPEKGYFHYTNAGYGPIMLYRDKEKECFLIEPENSSIPIGVMPDVKYMEEKPIRLFKKDALILFTDGIHEARNEKEEEYGIKRLAEIIPGIPKSNASEMANAIISDVMNFVGNAEQYDDMTLLVLLIK